MKKRWQSSRQSQPTLGQGAPVTLRDELEEWLGALTAVAGLAPAPYAVHGAYIETIKLAYASLG